MSFQSWTSKQRGNPKLLLVAAIGFSVSFYGSYRWFYKPWETRRKLAEAEEYANILLSKNKRNDT